MNHLLRPAPGPGTLLEVTPQSAGWQYLDFKVVTLTPGQTLTEATGNREVAVVPLAGRATATVAGEQYALARSSVWRELPEILYLPPGETLTLAAETAFEVALGGAPAEGRYPRRLFTPAEMKREVRGGGPAVRQVNHVLAPPLPAERLILFEVYVPGGAWSGWPPHCHDGRYGSSYLEETYYYRVAPEAGFAIHRNYLRPQEGAAADDPFDELFTVRNGDLVLVTQGFHPVAAAPGSSIYFLNFLAGELIGEARATPPVDDPDHAWIKDDWEKGKLQLPIRFDNG